MCRLLCFFNNANFALLNPLKFNNTSPLYNNGFYYINRKEPNDEDLESEAAELDERHSNNADIRREAQQRIRNTHGFNPDTPQGERTCQAIEKQLEREYKKRRLDRDELNDKPGVSDPGYSPSEVSAISEDSDHRQLMEDERDYLNRKESEYRADNSHRRDYSETDAVEFARNCLNSLKDDYDNPETDSAETASEDERTSEPDAEDDNDNPDTGGPSETANEDERTSEPDTEDESSDSSNGSDKGSNIVNKIKDIFKGGKGGGSGSVSSGGSGEEGSNNNGGSDSGSNDFSTLRNFFFIFLSFIGSVAEYLEVLFL